jgi:hypothetical protein
VGKPNEQMGPLPPDLVRLLTVAMADKSITIRGQAASVLQFAGGEPAVLADREFAREAKIYAQEAALDKTPRTREQIAAAIPPDANHKYPLTIEYLFLIYQSVAAQAPEYLISLHRGRERSDRLVFRKKIAVDKYKQVKVMESSAEVLSEGRFLPPTIFRAKVQVLGDGRGFSEFQQFVDVTQTECNTWCAVDNVFAIYHGGFVPVQIESPEKWYKSRLKPGESTRKFNRNSFCDDRLSFPFAIWAREDPHSSPSGGQVTGTYKIVRETNAQPVGRGVIAMLPSGRPYAPYAVASSGGGRPLVTPLVTWKMVVDRAARKPFVWR